MKRTRLSPVSAARLEEADEYLDVRMAVNVRDRGRCQAAAILTSMRCDGPNDPHHVHPVGDGGPRLELGNIITCCRAMHDWIHAHTRAARRLGLLAGGGVTWQEAERRRASATPESIAAIVASVSETRRAP